MLKQLLRILDDKLLEGGIQKSRLRRRQRCDVARVEDRSSEKFYVFYDKHYASEMAGLCDKYGSDKGSLKTGEHVYRWMAHSYTDFYSRTFSHCRRSVRKVFECGLGTNSPALVSSMGIAGKPGASLRMWKDYFPEAIIYGGDIDEQILFHEERIKTFYLDQLDPQAISAFWQQVGERDFDLMIDDGLHTFEGGTTLFEHSIEQLADTGIYVIEDVLRDDLVRYKNFFDNTDYLVDYVTMFRPKVGLGDNSLIAVRKTL
jgi:hypothetical protein